MSTSSKAEICPYFWGAYEENGSTGIRIFGLNDQGENCFVLVTDFSPYAYLELPENVTWNFITINALSSKLDSLAGDCKPVKREFKKSKKLYYAKYDVNTNTEKEYSFLKCYFGCQAELKKFSWKVKNEIYISGVGKIRLKLHEIESNPILQFQCSRNLKPSSWFSFKGKEIPLSDDDRLSTCVREYEANNKSFVPIEKNKTVRPCILSFDIEVNSVNPNKVPDHNIPGDRIFQISAVLCRSGEQESKWEKFLLTLCKNKTGEIIELNQEKVGNDIELRMFETEGDLLEGFTELVNEKNPNVIIGYNIFKFDLPYMYERSKICRVTGTYDQMSFIKGEHSKMKEIKWGSKAFGDQKMEFMDTQGRIWIDLYPVIFRDYKLDNYKLKTVSEFFLGEGQTKDPLTVKGIFKCYRMFTTDSLSVVGKYCVQDSLLVLKLFEKLQLWIGLCEMSNTCNVPIFTLFTQGQQIKMYSQVYKKCLHDNIVIDSEAAALVSPSDTDDKYTGAYVFPPVPGLYEMVTSYDFSSLYPSAIIAYNIDYTTLVLDKNVPDDKCHIFDWHDHLGCSHDQIIRKTKIKNPICEKRYFRFLKEPLGIVPTLLKNLLDARKKTNAEKKELQKLLGGLQGVEKEDIERMIVVLDKRQLSYKINANSMYGAMGARKGYLPFLPGAMCTTFKGRVSIEKAAKWLVENHQANLVYGDSVVKYTPIYVRVNGVFDICTIENLPEKYGSGNSSGWQTCEEDGKQEKEFYEFDNVHIETWTKKGWTKLFRIIRHDNCKKIMRILTHTGMVDVTDDHSLILSSGEKTSSKNIGIGTELLHNDHPINEEENHECKITEDEATIMGFFMGDGSCGDYDCPSGNKCTWALNNASQKLLNKYLELCKKIYNKFNWVVMDTLESSGVYKISPRSKGQESISDWIKEYRSKMYHKKSKIIPVEILNAPEKIRQAFFNGLYDADGDKDKNGYTRIDQKNQISASHICWLGSSLGYKTSINIRNDKENVYRVTMTKKNQRKNPIAVKKMCEIDYEGYVYDLTTENHQFAAGIGKMIVHNTDSCYVSFPQYTTPAHAKDMDSFCREIESQISLQFPKPMKMAYEEHIYAKYLILSKKRYMALTCDNEGNVEKKMTIRGVLLSRRDNSHYEKDFYNKVIMKSFYKEPMDEVVYMMSQEMSRICSGNVPIKDLIITKSIGDVASYKIRPLDNDDKKCQKRLESLDLYDEEADLDIVRKILNEFIAKEDVKEYEYTKPLEYKIVMEYISKALPGQVQLAQKVRARGGRVEVGERMGFIVIESKEGLKAKVSQKLEDPEYYKEHAGSLRIDPLYYVKKTIKQFDEVLDAVYKVKDTFKNCYKYRENHHKMIQELNNVFSPKIVLVD